MWHRLAHRVGRSMQTTPAAVDKSTQRLEHKNSDTPAQCGQGHPGLERGPARRAAGVPR